MRDQPTRGYRRITCAICRRMIGNGEPREVMLLGYFGDTRAIVHATCAADYRRRARELLDLLDRGNAMLGIKSGGV